MMNQKFKNIYELYHFIGLTPFKIDVALGAVAFMSFLVLFGLDFCFQVSANAWSIGFILVNLAGIVGCIVYLGNLQEVPKTYSEAERRAFNFKKSLKMTRLVQKEEAQFVDASPYFVSGKAEGQKYSNAVRLLSFVAVLNDRAYLFLRLPINVSIRQDNGVYMAIASDVASQLGLRLSAFQRLDIADHVALGHYHYQTYNVMELR